MIPCEVSLGFSDDLARAEAVAVIRVAAAARDERTSLGRRRAPTLIGLQAAFLLGGAVVTETMFSWPGVGRLAVGAIISSDFPTAQGAIMILALAFLLINLLVDVMYVYLDPRVARQ